MREQKQNIQLLAESRRSLKIKRPGENRMIFIGLGVLILVGLAYGGLRFYFHRLGAQLTNVSDQIVNLESQRDKSLEKEIVAINQRLSLAGQLINNHIVISNGLAKLQSLTPLSVQYTRLSIKTTGQEIAIGAVAPTYTVIAKQIAGILEDGSFDSVFLGSIGRNTAGFLEYNLNLTFLKNKLIMHQSSDTQ